MDYSNIIELAAAMGTAIGGWEFIKYMLNIRTNKRKEKSEADKAQSEAKSEDFNRRTPKQSWICNVFDACALSAHKENQKTDID